MLTSTCVGPNSHNVTSAMNHRYKPIRTQHEMMQNTLADEADVQIRLSLSEGFTGSFLQTQIAFSALVTLRVCSCLYCGPARTTRLQILKQKPCVSARAL